ncbi:hypothetical protein HY065_02055 [Candidatus Berkelbacteria bacterium]|nr:hypothetical protein [Candidatus Berkelbacteria bacterium]
MTEEEKKVESSSLQEQEIEKKIMPWRFWLLITLSLLLIVTFGAYLPLRFQFEGMMHGMVHGGHAAMYQEENTITSGLAVNLAATPFLIEAGTSTRLDFFVNQKPGNIPVSVGDLEIEHTKLMHVIGVRDDMNEFFHIHPQPTSTPGFLAADHIFSRPGMYKIWSQIKKDGVIHTFGHPQIDVKGAGERSRKEVSFARSVTVQEPSAGQNGLLLYRVTLDLEEPVVKGVETDLSFDIHEYNTGRKIEVEPYLGADMHLAIIKDDFTQFIHTHPEGHEMNMGEQHHGALRVMSEAKAHGIEEGNEISEVAGKTINFRVVFPESGLYRMYAQFRPKGTNVPPDESLTASFWVRVEETGPIRISKLYLVLISLILMLILSWAVKKMLIAESTHL